MSWSPDPRRVNKRRARSLARPRDLPVSTSPRVGCLGSSRNGATAATSKATAPNMTTLAHATVQCRIERVAAALGHRPEAVPAQPSL